MNNQAFSKIWIIFIVIILIGGGFVIWQYQLLKGRKVVEEAPKELEKPEEIANWKTYQDTEYGFEIKYPENYKITKLYKEVVITFPSQARVEIKVESNPKHKSLAEHVSSGHLQWEPIVINEIEGIKAKIKKNGYGILKGAAFLAGDEEIFKIILLSEKSITEKEIEIFNQILSTFRFLD
jgi:predicted Zn-dependent protease